MNNDLKKVLVLGGGAWGTALAKVLAYNVNNVFLYIRDKRIINDVNQDSINNKKLPGITLPNNVVAINSYNNICDITTAIVAIPVRSLNLVFSDLKSITRFNNFVICSKGISAEDLTFPSQICKKHFPKAEVALLSGPNFAKEVALEKNAKTLIASKNLSLAKHLQNIFKTNYFSPKISDDVIGVEACGAIKNVIAIATGIAKGLDLGENFIASLVVAALEEIKTAVKALNGNTVTVYSLAGLGDLLLTSYSFASRNMSFGYELAKTQQLARLNKNTIEGYYTAKSIFYIAKKLNIKMPICNYVYNVLYNNENIYNIMNL